jgi:hypothetical protein
MLVSDRCARGHRKPAGGTDTRVKVTVANNIRAGALAIGRASAAAAAIVLVLTVMAITAFAATLAPGEQQCLTCHAMTGVEMPLTGGGTLSLHVAGDAFAKSVHNAIGCTGCHSDIDRATHPGSAKPVASARAFSIAMSQVCGNCHNDQNRRWSRSVHAALVRDGNPAAPVCSNCHAPHAVMKGEAASLATIPCKSCHSAIFTAYLASVHGVARSQGVTVAPLCFGCHGAHDIAVPSAGQRIRDVCLGCHTEAAASHRTWLPNVDLHFTAVSCPVCHTPQAQRVVDLVLYNSATQQEVSEPPGVPQFENLTQSLTATRPELDPATLMALLRALDRTDAVGKTIIRGRLEVRTGVEDHQIVAAAKAISNCNTCHERGAAAFQSVQIAVAGPAGIPVYIGANKDVLSSAYSINSVGGFYAIGGSRITLLDVLFLLALAAGVGWSVLHGTARLVFWRFGQRSPPDQPKG